MRTRFQTMIDLVEIGEFTDDLRAVFLELDRRAGSDLPPGECSPPLDLRETDEAVEVRVDLPGVGPDAVWVVVKAGALFVAGEKRPRRGRGDSSFHLVERDFGRFARTVRLPVPCDSSQARAVLASGELLVTIPRVTERRGRRVQITVGREA